MNPEEIRRLADEIVAREEFRAPSPSLIERVRSWVEDQIGRIVEAAFSGSAGSLVGWAVLVVAVVAGVWFLTRVGRTVQADTRVGIRVEGVHRRTPAEWRAEAEDHEAAGEWKLALRSRYRALVADLTAEGVLDGAVGATTGEFRAQVRRRVPDRAVDFSAATDLFEWAWYADRATGPEQSGRFRELADRVTGVRV